MFSRTDRRISASALLAVVALVFAMTGGAFAAKKYLITSTSQIKPSVLKKLRGATGAPGANGAAGPTGPAGANGKDGTNGTNGLNGKDGINGTNGVSVTNAAIPAGDARCGQLGGAEFKVGAGAATFACNGAEGSPWTAGGTLPPGETLKGHWAANWAVDSTVAVPISFNIPLDAVPVIHYVEGGDPAPAGCSGTFEEPEADPGHLCVFVALSLSSEEPSVALQAPDKFGAILGLNGKAGSVLIGSWAVTAAE
jgi:hypothetical protein